MTIRPSRWSGKVTPASIAARLPAEAKRRGLSVEAVRDAYVREAFFRRLVASPWRDRFVLKGSVLLVGLLHAWHRPTLDADFLVLEALNGEALAAVMRSIIALPAEDGVIFDPASLRLNAMQEDARMVGQRVTMTASLGRGLLHFRADIGFNDIVTPAPQALALETVLSSPIEMLGSTLATAVAEKFDAMIDHGLANTRAKDFYDLAYIASYAAMDGEALLAAIRATFGHRGRDLPVGWPEVLDQVAANQAQINRYRQFLAQAGHPEADDLPTTLRRIRSFLEEPLRHLDPATPFHRRWSPETGWGTA